MSTEGKIKTLFSDEAKTEALFPRTKISAVSDEDGTGLNVLLDNIKDDLLTQIDEKAPAGYGLGESVLQTITDSELQKSPPNGWYFVPAASSHTSAKGVAHVSNSGNNLCIINFWDVNGSHLRRKIVDGWGYWEWENPPMIAGIEYRTTERWNGKAVYAKLIDCGTTVAGRKQIPNNSLYGTPIRAAGKISNSISPFIHLKNLESTYTGYINVEGSEISVYSAVAGNTAYVTIWYTKD